MFDNSPLLTWVGSGLIVYWRCVMRWLGLLVISISLMFFAGLYNPTPAHAAVNYNWEYDFVNRYSTQFLTYTFSNLDANTTYTWNVFAGSTQGGGFTRFGSFTSTPADRSGSPTDESFQIVGIPGITTPGIVVYPDTYTGPLVVIDGFNGTILGQHFIARFYNDPQLPNTSGWLISSGSNTSLGEKQLVGNTQATGSCRSPLYNEVNSDGWMHSFIPCSVTTLDNGWALFHFQITAAYDPAMDDDVIEFYRVPTSTVEFSLSLNELIAYQQTGTYTPGTTQAWFVVINTGSTNLSFIDNNRCSSFSTGMNPCRADLSPGVFNYSRYDQTPSWVSDGESVWIITEDPNLLEWTLTRGAGEVQEAGRQTVTTRAVTEEVWNSYHGFQEVEDVPAGFSDTTVYAFARSRPFTYQVANAILTGVEPTWENRPSALFSGLATPVEMAFIVSTSYNIVDRLSFEEAINTNIVDLGLDTNAGRAALLTIILFVGMLGTAAFTGLRGNIWAYMVVWTGLGAVFHIGTGGPPGYGTPLTLAVFSVMTIGMWIFAITMGQVREDY